MKYRRLEVSLLLAVIVFTFLISAIGVARAAPTICQIGNGCTGTSTSPGYGQLLIGNSNGGYNLTSTSSLGTSYFTNSTANTYLNTGTNLEAPTITATSTGTVNSPALTVGGTGSGIGLYDNSGGLGFGTGSAGITWDGGELYPNTSALKNLGSPTNIWNHIFVNYATTTDIDVVRGTGTATSTITENGAGYLQVQSASTTDTDSELEILAPNANPFEADLAENIVPAEGGSRFVDWDNQDNSADQVDITEGVVNGAIMEPFVLQMCHVTAFGFTCQHNFVALPNGTVGFGMSTSTIDQNSAVQVSSSTATRIFEADTNPGTHIFYVGSSGATTTNLAVTSQSAGCAQFAADGAFTTTGTNCLSLSAANLWGSVQTFSAGLISPASSTFAGTLNAPGTLALGYNPWNIYEDASQELVIQPAYPGYYAPRSIITLEAPDADPQEATFNFKRPVNGGGWNGSAYTDWEGMDTGCESYDTGSGESTGIDASDHVCYLENIAAGNGTTTPIRLGSWNMNTASVVALAPATAWFDPGDATNTAPSMQLPSTALGNYASTTSNSLNRYDPNIALQVLSTSTETTSFDVETTARTHNLLDLTGTGWFGISSSTPGSTLSVGGVANFTTGTSTFYGNGLNLSAGCFAIAGTCLTQNGGTVTSISGSGGTSGLTLTGGPITSSGTLTIGGTLAVANGGTGISTIGASSTVLTTNGTAAAWQQINLGAAVYGTLSIVNGGTGQASFGQGWLYSNGGTSVLAASTSPTVASINATSTTATSTFQGNISVSTSGDQSAVPEIQCGTSSGNNYCSGASGGRAMWGYTTASGGMGEILAGNGHGLGFAGNQTNNVFTNGGIIPSLFISGGSSGTGNTGSVAVGSTSPIANFQATTQSSNATTSVEFGKASQNKGTCMTYFDEAGSPVYMFFAPGATTPIYQNGGTMPAGCSD